MLSWWNKTKTFNVHLKKKKKTNNILNLKFDFLKTPSQNVDVDLFDDL